MENTVKLVGTIKFDPKDKTKKHANQASWKKIAMVMFEGDITEYYAWFIKRRFNLPLNKPLRGAHITFINDKASDITGSWDKVKKKWHNKKVEVVLDLNPKTDSNNKGSTLHWWLKVPEDDRKLLHGIRAELGLGRPYWGLHMSIGYANEKNAEHSKYLHRLVEKGIIK